MKSIKNLLTVLITAALITTAFAQETENRTLPTFTKINLESIGKVYLTQDATQSVKVTTSGSLKKIETEVSGNTLNINCRNDADIYISMAKLEGLEISGSAAVEGQSSFTCDQLKLEVSGSGKITLNATVKDLKVDIGGIGKIVLSGSAENANIDISGSGKVEAMDMKITNCKANISGVGKCNVDVTDNLNADISGSGNINYKTRPKNVTENTSGVGRIREASSSGGTSINYIKDSDTTRLMLGGTKILIINDTDSLKMKRNRKRHTSKPIWQGFEMGFNNYVNASGKMGVPSGYDYLDLNDGKSVSVGLNIIQQNFRIIKNNLWFFTGLGITWNNYRFDKRVTISSNPNSIEGTIDSSSNINYIKSKLTASYVTAPFMFEVFTSENIKKAFHIGAGALLGYRIGSHTKQKYELSGQTSKPKTYDDFNLNPFQYGFRVALGYRKFNVFGDYYASTLFKEGKGPVLYPINVGLTFVGF